VQNEAGSASYGQFAAISARSNIMVSEVIEQEAHQICT